MGLAGCGDDTTPPAPDPVVGNYTIKVDANGQSDDNRMYVTVGSSQNVLMNFLYGISEVRGTLEGSTALTLPRQTLDVQHSTGDAEGVATGDGTFTTDSVDLTIHLTTPGFGPANGGGLGGSGPVDYHLTGTKD